MKLEMSNFYGYRGDQWQENAWSYKKCSIIPLSDLTHLVIPHLVEAKKTEMNLMAKLSCFVDTPVKMEPKLMDGLYQIFQWVNQWGTFLIAKWW